VARAFDPGVDSPGCFRHGPASSATVSPRVAIAVTEMLELLSFIRRSVRSVWALELLLLIRRPPVRTWSTGELVVELRASEAVVNGVLGGFVRDGVVAPEAEGGFRFASGVAALDEICEALAETYRERPTAVIKAIAAPDDQLTTLAAAFRLRDPPP